MKNPGILNLMLIAAMAACSACGKSETAAPAPQEPAAPQRTITATVKADKVDLSYARKGTYFKLPNANGGELDLAAYSGKPVLMMFFTENCSYCRKAAPFIQSMHKTYSPKGLNTVGICLSDTADSPKAFAKDMGLTFPLAYKGEHTFITYKAQGVPFIYLLDKSHEIQKVWGGYDSYFDREIIENIEKSLK